MSRRAGTTQRAFNGGEQSPLLGARGDLASWLTALDTCENFITLVPGGLTRRSGWRDVYAEQANSRLIEFAFSGSDGYAVEFAPSPGNIRFFRDYGILTSGGSPYEIPCPFSAADVAVLDFAQTADRLFLACGSQPIQQLQRNGNTSWVIAAATIANGPFRDPNLDQTASLSCGGSGEIPAGTTGLTVTAAAGTPFNALHVGATFRIRVKDESKHGKWKNGVGSTVGDIVVWDGNWYKCTATLGTNGNGTNPPVHLYGEAWDGPIVGDSVSAAKWQYLHSGFGIIQVTGFSSSSVVTAKAVTYIPDDLRTGTWRWEECAWSGYRGYPRHIGIHKKRLYAASNAAQPLRVWASEIDNYIGFDDSTTDADKAFSFDLESDSGEVSFPQWLVSGKKLALGTSHNEFLIGSADVTSPITPTSVDPESQTNEGSATVLAIKVDNPVWVSKDGKRVNTMGIDANGELAVTDLTLKADHISGPGSTAITRLTWLRDPYRLLVALRSDGVLLTAAYRKDQQVIGWHRHPMAGTVLDICRAPSPSGIRQDLWAKVQYALPGGTVTRIQSLMPFFERGDLTSASAWFVDSGFQYSGAATKTIDLIPAFLIGATVAVRADGKDIGTQVVASGGTGGTGKITLDANATLVTLGLPFTSRARTLRYDRRLQGRGGRVSSVSVDVIRSGVVNARANSEEFQVLRGKGDDPVDQPETLTTGVLEVPLPSGWDGDGNVEICVSHTGPLTIRAITPHLQEAA